MWYPKNKGKYSRKNKLRGSESVEEDAVHFELRSNENKLTIDTVTKSIA